MTHTKVLTLGNRFAVNFKAGIGLTPSSENKRRIHYGRFFTRKQFQFDLTDVYQIGNLAGESQVWIAFLFSSDVNTTEKGVYLDEVNLRKDVGQTDPQPILLEHFTCKDGDDAYNT